MLIDLAELPCGQIRLNLRLRKVNYSVLHIAETEMTEFGWDEPT